MLCAFFLLIVTSFRFSALSGWRFKSGLWGQMLRVQVTDLWLTGCPWTSYQCLCVQYLPPRAATTVKAKDFESAWKLTKKKKKKG